MILAVTTKPHFIIGLHVYLYRSKYVHIYDLSVAVNAFQRSVQSIYKSEAVLLMYTKNKFACFESYSLFLTPNVLWIKFLGLLCFILFSETYLLYAVPCTINQNSLVLKL